MNENLHIQREMDDKPGDEKTIFIFNGNRGIYDICLRRVGVIKTGKLRYLRECLRHGKRHRSSLIRGRTKLTSKHDLSPVFTRDAR